MRKFTKMSTALCALALAALGASANAESAWDGFYAGLNAGEARNSTCNNWSLSGAITDPAVLAAFSNRSCPSNSSSLVGFQFGYSGAIGGGLGITENARLDNSIKYENKVGYFSFGAQYKFNQTDSSEAADVGSDLEGMVGFKDGPLSVELVGSKSKNTPALGFKLFTSDVSLRISDTSGFMLAAKYELTPKATLNAGVEHTDQSNTSSLNNWGTQITTYYGMSLAGLVTAKPYNPAWGAAPITAVWVGGGYQLTEAFSLDAGYYDVDNGGNSHNDQYTIRQISLMPDYHLSKRFDVYAGLMFTHYSGSYVNQFAPIALATDNVLYGIGLRARLSKEIL